MTPPSIDNPRQQFLVDFFRDVWNAGDVSACERYLAPSYTIFHDPGDPWAGQVLDVAGFQQRLQLSRAPFPDQAFELLRLVDDGDAIVTTWNWTATHRGDLPGFPATGQRVAMSGVTVYSFVDDRLCGHWQVVDRLGVFQQLQAQKSPS